MPPSADPSEAPLSEDALAHRIAKMTLSSEPSWAAAPAPPSSVSLAATSKESKTKTKGAGSERRRRQRETAQAGPRLPPEVLLRIIQVGAEVTDLEVPTSPESKERRQYLVKLSLVSWLFRHEAQRLLWEQVLITSDAGARNFLLSANKKWSTRILELSALDLDESSTWFNGDLAQQGVWAARDLSHLKLEGVKSLKADTFYSSTEILRKSCRPSFSAMTLTLFHCRPEEARLGPVCSQARPLLDPCSSSVFHDRHPQLESSTPTSVLAPAPPSAAGFNPSNEDDYIPPCL